MTLSQSSPDQRQVVRPRADDLWTVGLGVMLLVGVALTSQVNFLVFHGLTGLFSVAVAWSIFMIAWNARRHIADDTLLLLGIASVFVGGLDLLHTLAYQGMNVFPGYDANLPTQLWIAARAMQSLSLLAATLLLYIPHRRPLGRDWAPRIAFAGYGAATGLLVWAIFARAFPVCYVEGVGLTPFKRVSEVVISLVLLLSGVLMWRRRQRFSAPVLTRLLAFIGASIVSELAFTLYVGGSDLNNITGRLAKVVAFFLLYRAIVHIGIDQPYAFVSRELQETAVRLRSYIDRAPHGILIIDEAKNVVEVNPAACRITGYTSDEFLQLSIQDLLPPESHAFAAQHLRQVVETGQASGEMAFRRKDGSIGYCSVDAVRLSPTRFIGFATDVTDRVRTEAALRTSEERFRSIAERVSDTIYLTDARGIITYISPAARSTFGYEPEEMVGRPFSGFLDESAVAPAMAGFREALESGSRTRSLRLRMKRRDGSTFMGEVNGSSRVAGSDPGTLGVIRDISDRERAEREREALLGQVREQVQRVQGILDTVPEGVLLLDADGMVVLANPPAERDLALLSDAKGGARVTQLGGRPLTELLAPHPQGLWHEVTAGSRTFEVVSRPVTGGLGAQHFVLVISDVTQARQVEAERRHQERLAAVGQLAAGIAHDFNNILAVILLYAQMDLRAPDLPGKFRAHIGTIAQETQHAANLVQQILDFGRRAILTPHPMDLIPLLKEQTKLLARTLPESIRVALTYAVPEAIVDADATRMQQMITNLAVNARDAMPDGGVLQLALERTDLERDQAPPLPDMAPGEWVKLTVCDTGTGIGPKAREHLFEPFYTTKEPGKGSGLGLAQVYGIVKQHNGHIDVATEVGHGTTFTIYLPTATSTQPSESRRGQSLLPRGQGETILVVEDNAALREALLGTLEELAYRTLAAANGREALAILEQDAAARATGLADSGAPIDLVLSDMVMPDMGGQALFHALRERGWRVPMVIISGHPMQQQLEALQAEGLAGWLMKPAEIGDLAELLARALRSGGS